MSWFSVGGVVGFALAPMLTTALVVGWGIKGVLILLLPTGLAPGCAAGDDPLIGSTFNRGSSRCPPINLREPVWESGGDHHGV